MKRESQRIVMCCGPLSSLKAKDNFALLGRRSEKIRGFKVRSQCKAEFNYCEFIAVNKKVS
jgi:hypothetical protein